MRTSRRGDAAALAFHCRDVGVACGAVTQADTAEQLVAKVSEHARAKHHVELNDTLVDYAVTKVRHAGE